MIVWGLTKITAESLTGESFVAWEMLIANIAF